MGFKQIRTSDLTGKELADADVVTVICREAGKVLDAAADELAGLKRVNNVVELEVRNAEGQTESILVSRTDYEKLITPEVLANADNIRGRRKGFSPSGNGG